MDELDEILQKEEDLYDDLIEPQDKLRHKHPLFILLAVIALIAVIIWALEFFIGGYVPWRREMQRQIETSETVD